MAGVQRTLGVLPVRNVPCDRKNALLTVKRQRPCRHQAGDDRSVLAAKRSFEPHHLAVAGKPIEKSLPVVIAHPYAQTTGSGRLPDYILRREPGDLREPLVHGDIDPVRHPVDVDRVGADMECFRVLFFRVAERAVSVMETKRHLDRGEQDILPRLLQHVPVIRDPPGACNHLPLAVRGQEYYRDIPYLENFAGRLSTVHPPPEIDIH